MFCGFNEETIQYWEKLRVQNDKKVFLENQDLYKNGIKEPLEELYFELQNFFGKLDFDIGINKRSCISSPYNDARFCNGNPMKEYVYVRFKVLKAQKDNTVGFFFDASEGCFRYGLQIYHLNARGMERIRSKLLEDRRKSQKIIEDFEASDVMKVCGIKYKKPYYEDEKEPLKKWLNMRTISFEHEEALNETFFSRKLLEEMLLAFREAQDVYFMIKDALK